MNPRPVIEEKSLERVSALLQPLAADVQPSVEFRKQLRRRLLLLPAASVGERSAA